jgi:hypothetical protein
MKRKKDPDVIDVSGAKTYRKRMKELEGSTASPCASCLNRDACTSPWYCKQYNGWRKKYMKDVRQ